MPIFSSEKLLEITRRIFEAAGAPEEYASMVAEHLVESNLVGHDSHGIVRIIRYTQYIRNGRLKVAAKPRVIKDGPATAIIDGNWGFGQVAACIGMNMAMKKAERNVLGAVGITNCNHIGRLGAYAEQAAKNNLVGIVFCNGAPAMMAPYGGKKRALANNPIAIGIPTGDNRPFLLDFATSVAAEGKIRVNFHEKKLLPEGWILDNEGKPSRNPADLYDGGALLPFGGYKGYAIAVAADLLCGALVGAGCTTGLTARERQTEGKNGVLMIAVRVDGFTPLDIYKKRVRETLDKIKSTPPSEGFERVMIPGEPEQTTMEKRLNEGISVPEEIWERIKQIGDEFGVELLVR